jgi:hypothetical protein
MVAHQAFLLPDNGSVPLFEEMQQQLATVATVGRPPPGRVIQGSGHLLGLGDTLTAGSGRRRTAAVEWVLKGLP